MNLAEQQDFMLRSPTLEDMPAVVEMLNACWSDTVGSHPFDMEEMRVDWASPGFDYTQDIRLAMDGDQIAGLALCVPKDTDDPDMCWVNSLSVRRPWRRRGVALALLHHAFGEAYRRGIRKVGLGVDASSLTGATRLYEKAGMHVYRQWDAYQKELRPGEDLSTQQLDH